MQRKLLAVGAAWALLAVSAGPAVANGDVGGLVGVAQSAVRIVQGLSSRTKVIEIEGADPEQVERALSNES